MRRNIIILLIIVSVLIASTVQAAEDKEFTTAIKNLTRDLTADIKDKKTGYIIKKQKNKIYLNQGRRGGIEVGDEFKVVRREEVLTDPLTGVSAGQITNQLAKIKVTAVKKNYSTAKVESYYTAVDLQVMDKVLPIPYKIGVLNFSISGISNELKERVRDYSISYLQDQNNFEVISSSRLNQLASKLQVEKITSQASKNLISDSLGLDFLITGEVYQKEKKVFIRGELYNARTELITAEEIKTFSTDNELIKYYQLRSEEETASKITNSYQHQLLGSKIVNYPALDLAVANIDGDDQLEVVLVTEQGLKILKYQKGDLLSDQTIKTYNRTKYDDYKVVIGRSADNSPVKIWGENSNQIVEFVWSEENYKKEVISNFTRTRPKLVADWGGKKYLVTRNYQHQVKFNLLAQDNYKTDFKLQLAKNEGYRIEMGNLDKDQKQELLVTAYQGNKDYKVKVYDLKGDVKTVLPESYGAELAILNSVQGSLLIVHTTEDQPRVLFYKYRDSEYQQVSEISNLKLPIRDLAVANINNDQQEQLFILTGNKQQSKIYIYQLTKTKKEKN